MAKVAMINSVSRKYVETSSSTVEFTPVNELIDPATGESHYFAVSNEVRADFDILFRYVDGLKHRIDCLERTHDFEQLEIDRLENEVEEYAQTLRDVESWSLWKHIQMWFWHLKQGR